MTIRFATTAAVFLLAVGPAWAQDAAPNENTEAAPFETEIEQVSYAIGVDVARTTERNGIDIDFEAFSEGFTDMRNGELQMSPQQMQQALQSFMMRRQQEMQAEQHKQAEENLAAANAFLAENKTKEGVQELESGVQYIVVEEGTGPVPQPTDTVEVHYTGTFPDGTQFDSSRDRDRTFKTKVTGGIIAGWQDALQHMKEGARWKVFIPPALAYGEGGRGEIPPNQLLIFDMELLRIVPPEEAQAPAQPQEPKLITPQPQGAS